jgi:hypothetical protein
MKRISDNLAMALPVGTLISPCGIGSAQASDVTE